MEIQGNTLFIQHESGNIGHFFNDHVYSSFAYYLINKENINQIYIYKVILIMIQLSILLKKISNIKYVQKKNLEHI